MSLPASLHKFGMPIPVLDQGHVLLIDTMGDDNAIVSAARVSYDSYASKHTDKQNRGLIRYLLRHGHTTPFEMCEIKFRIKAPMDCWRQWIRHRMANVNEISTRYTEVKDELQVANVWRKQSKSNKQGSEGIVEGFVDASGKPLQEHLSEQEKAFQEHAMAIYHERIEAGVAREQARKDLPLCTYTEAYWKIDLHNLLHFLRLRMDPHAQEEIRLYANAIAEIVKEWVPWTWEAFEDYYLQSMKFSREEVNVLLQSLDIEKAQALLRESQMSKREKREFLEKITC